MPTDLVVFPHCVTLHVTCLHISIRVGSNQVDSVDSFVYLGCLQSSSGQCRPDLKRRIGFASLTMSSLSRIWKDKHLTTATKVRLYQVLVMSVLLYAAETWTLLAAGRPNNRWVDQIHNSTGNISSTLWRSAILRGHGTGVKQRPSPATRTWWRWWNKKK